MDGRKLTITEIEDDNYLLTPQLFVLNNNEKIKLCTLALINNELTSLPVGIFDNLVDLKELQLFKNQQQ